MSLPVGEKSVAGKKRQKGIENKENEEEGEEEVLSHPESVE
jgi:hypothetical protein